MSKTILLILFVCINSCEAQFNKQNTKDKKKQIMDKFDQMLFDKNKTNGQFIFQAKDGSEIKQWEIPSEQYVEQKRKVDSPFEIYKEYYYTSKYLKKEGQLFYGFPIGIWKEYNESGTVTREKNEDEPFKFSINDLDNKLKNMGIFIMKRKQKVSVFRSANPSPNYKVTYPVAPDNSVDVKVLIIDGITGKTIKEAIVTKVK